jgi:hypothetical protein
MSDISVVVLIVVIFCLTGALCGWWLARRAARPKKPRHFPADSHTRSPTMRVYQFVFSFDAPQPDYPCLVEEITEPLELKVCAADVEDEVIRWERLIETGRGWNNVRPPPMMEEAKRRLARAKAVAYDPVLRPRLFKLSRDLSTVPKET